ncbi:MAG TPA: protein translocase subunit SecD [Sedimentisphaerales bacterium]|nr:protein translocase subunit SecD [Sedimentisphaerales bacterium]
MEKRLSLKLLLVVAITALLGWRMYPPSQTLRQGLDLQGGTSLIYAIDMTGLAPAEQRDVAQRLVPIMRQRIDPQNMQNLVVRPQGFGKIEIQMPLASKDVQERRMAYDAAAKAIQAGNMNIALVERAAAIAPERRASEIEKLVGDSAGRRKIIDDFLQAYDEMRRLSEQSDVLSTRLESLRTELTAAGVNADIVRSRSMLWSALSVEALGAAIADQMPDAVGQLPAIRKYLDVYKEWADTVNAMTVADTGANDRYRTARAQLGKLNINMDVVQQTILELPTGSAERNERLRNLLASFPERQAQIESLVAAFDSYRGVRGRLDDPEDLRRILLGVGVLEFRILPRSSGVKPLDATEIAVRRQNLETYGPARASDEKYVWVETEITDPEEWNASVPDSITHMFGQKLYVLASNQPDEVMLHTGRDQAAWQLSRAYPDFDQETGTRAIGFTFNEIGANGFFRLTSRNLERPLAILLDGVAISAPRISTAIRSRGIITGGAGGFTQTEVADMVNKLNAGSLPARLIDPPIATRTIGPSIGVENRDAGIRAGIIGLAVAAVFMAVYYRRSGGIANVALIMNLIFILSAMAFTGSTFTLPGIAGIILTIGMAVDANVLINERIREEQSKGCSVRVAIKNGYDRAFITIFDSNVTTFITALILYIVASEEIKGFAITLMLGIISSMITSIWVTRLIFQWLLQKKIVVDQLRMMQIFNKPNINWMALRPVFFIVSSVAVLGSWAVFFARDDSKNSKYHIEFTGGTAVTIDLKEPMTRNDVEQAIHSIGERTQNPRLAAAIVYSVGTDNMQFEINTLETNRTAIEVTFVDEVPSETEVQQAIVAAEEQFPGGRLANLTVLRQGQMLKIETTQPNYALVKEIVTAAFRDRQVAVGEPHVDEVVNNAIIEAFGDRLRTNQDLGPTIVNTEMIDDSLLDREPQLAAFYGGVKMTVTLRLPVTAAQLDQRFTDLRYKPGMHGLDIIPHEIFKTDLSLPLDDEELTELVYVSRIPEAGYRDLAADEIAIFIDNETTKILQAASLTGSLPRVTQIDPSIGRQAKVRALIALILAGIAITAYLWVRFGRPRYGLAGIVALAHDVSLAVGAVVGATYLANTGIGRALLIGDFKINLEMIAAFLTIIGYSINDTIVIFDRIRENRGKGGMLTPKLINDSINQTLSRTVLTSFTTLLVVFVMYVWGGPGLRGLNYALMVGIIVGSYSTIAIAAPLLLFGSKGKEISS